jgi:hypothetical protein
MFDRGLAFLDPPESKAQKSQPPYLSRSEPFVDPLISPAPRAAGSPGDSAALLRLSSVEWRHSGWAHQRLRVATGLRNAFGTGNRLDAFLSCGSAAWVWEDHAQPGAYKVTSNCCKDRWCQPCARHRGRVIANALCTASEGADLRFLTLTQKHRDETAKESVNRLFASWNRFRRRKAFLTHVAGGAAVVELKRSKHAPTWHTHLHVLIEGRFWKHSEIKAEWLAATGDSSIVDIRPVRDHQQIALYLCKYLTKPIDATVFTDPELLLEAMQGLHARRLVTTFGTWRGIDLDAEPGDGDWHLLCPLTAIFRRAATGDPVAITILKALSRTEEVPCPTTASPNNPP